MDMGEGESESGERESERDRERERGSCFAQGSLAQNVLGSSTYQWLTAL